ncbi:UDP-N-acetylmuramoylalanine--D-glutamate ligase [Corynebacterium occultum]|uniref:UDP-N-acetylmuramoylalanine--D-glutamate ligase n=1 Tax=Corynebacterium occultum TaxID=2675219 RepID=A0A6B8WN89_9CORY|nr:UDP-N-acetylmuramoyl-L-alanine--D-glutamate ligase [Corynebacterium occultum]QGU07808.1 UDP-N-acetylmuramoylalanine--D-glutamate ligase [Corynebacterium occultum]
MSPHPILPPELNARVLVAGAGVSGTGCAVLLADLGVDLDVADDNADSLAKMSSTTQGRAGAISVATARENLGEYSLVVTSPGWRPDSPLLLDAAAAGLEVIGDVELAYRLDRAGVFGDPRTWLVVTGTNGKTTTTAMLEAMMSQGSRRALAVGNIGVAVADALIDPERVEILVAELSSFQLHWSSQLIPDAGLLLNLAEDHLDWHGDFLEYARAKAKVLQGEVAVIGADDPRVVEIAAEVIPVDSRKHPIGFTLAEPAPGQFGVRDGQLIDNSTGENLRLAPVEGIEPPGPAGVLDALGAAAIARSQGITPAQIAAALKSFRVAGHRGQVVHQARGVRFIDNSKATNPHAADSALAGLDSVIWVAGGQLKGAEIDDLIRTHAHRLRAALLLGVDAPLIEEALARLAPEVEVRCSREQDAGIAIHEVVGWAVELAQPGDTVVLAPAAASLDMFSGMAQRGDLFSAAAHEIMTETVPTGQSE